MFSHVQRRANPNANSPLGLAQFAHGRALRTLFRGLRRALDSRESRLILASGEIRHTSGARAQSRKLGISDEK